MGFDIDDCLLREIIPLGRQSTRVQMRLLPRTFSPSSWLAFAACGIVLNSCAMAPLDVTAPPPPAGHAVAAIWSPPFWVAGDPVSTTHPQVTVDWISSTDHYIPPASCHPHCQDNQREARAAA